MQKTREYDEDFADWIRRVREEQGLSLQAVANRSGGISKPYIGFLENRDKLPTDLSLKKLLALAHGLNLPIMDLLAEALDVSAPRIVQLPIVQTNQNDAKRNDNKLPARAGGRTNRGGA